MERSRAFGRSLAASLGLVALATAAGAQTSVRYSTLGPANFDRLGAAVAWVGDVNGDGRPDYAVGAPEDGFVFDLREGFVRILSGADGSLIRQHDGTTNAEGCGMAVAGGGLVDGDLVPDVIVGSPFFGPTETGRVRVFSGATGALIWTFTGTADAHLGRAVANAGDVDGDGRADILAGAPDASPMGQLSGRAIVYSGMTGAPLYTINGTTAGRRLGLSVAGVGDVNLDGRADFLVGSNNGATLYSGMTGTPLFATFTSGSADDVYGISVAGVGDVNGDGRPDFAIGATQDGSIFNLGAGFVHVRSGLDGSILHTFLGTQFGERFGLSLGGGFDLDGGGRPDILVGADQAGLGLPGFVRAFRGETGVPLFTVNGDANDDRFGTCVAAVGDGDGDGQQEFVVGAPIAAGGGTLRGLARLFEVGGGGGCPTPVNFCSLSPNSAGSGAQIGHLGTTSLSANDLVLRTTGLPPSAIGIYFYGAQEDSTPFGNGLRCVTGPQVFRMGASVASAGISTFPVNYAQLVQQPISAGQTWKFQFWFRDVSGGGAMFNLSDGLSATFCN